MDDDKSNRGEHGEKETHERFVAAVKGYGKAETYRRPEFSAAG
jgi:hypothetical protein